MARKPTSPEKRLRIWRIRARRKTLGWVAEPDAESAIRAAIEGFQVDKAHQNRLIAQPVGMRGRPTALTWHQRRLLREIGQIANIAKVDYPQIQKAYEPDERTTILHVMKDKIVRGDVVVKYTVLDEFLTDIICDYYFDRNEPHYRRLWKTKRFRVFRPLHHGRNISAEKVDDSACDQSSPERGTLCDHTNQRREERSSP